ncbi:MAG: hypothetical protein ACOX52_00220 [Verrucomicrobiota bacterium]
MAPGPHGPLKLRCRVATNNTVAVPGFSGPNPIPRSFDTETDSDPDPDLASPSPFSDDLWLGRKRHRVPCGRLSGSGSGLPLFGRVGGCGGLKIR